MEPLHFRSIWISDTHLGGRNLQSGKLLHFLQTTESDYLYLVGDILDFWTLKRTWFWPSINNQIVAAVLNKAARGTRVIYLPGNHDDQMRCYCGSSFNQISVAEEIVHRTVDGKRYLVLHGDSFDCVIQRRRWLADVGSVLYDWLLVINRWYNGIRSLLGRPYHSISAAIKQQVKQAVNYIDDFERIIVSEAHRKRVDGLICGHIHHAAIRDINGVLYSNTGDWVESCTALVENANGTLGIVDWQDTALSHQSLVTERTYEDRYRKRCLASTN